MPVIDVIEPGARALVQTTPVRPGRRDRHRRHDLLGRLPCAPSRPPVPTSMLTSLSCPGFVEFVERGQTHGEEVTILAERLLAADARGRRRRAAARLHALPVPRPGHRRRDGPGGDARVAAPTRRRSPPAASSASSVCSARADGDRPPSHRFLSSGDIAWFTDLGSRLLGPELSAAERWQPAG